MYVLLAYSNLFILFSLPYPVPKAAFLAIEISSKVFQFPWHLNFVKCGNLSNIHLATPSHLYPISVIYFHFCIIPTIQYYKSVIKGINIYLCTYLFLLHLYSYSNNMIYWFFLFLFGIFLNKYYSFNIWTVPYDCLWPQFFLSSLNFNVFSLFIMDLGRYFAFKIFFGFFCGVARCGAL